LFVIVGHPGETDRDFQETLAFLELNADSVDMIESSMCAVLKGSHLFDHQEEYGIRSDSVDPRRWSSMDGANDYTVRSGRYRALREASIRLGFRPGDDSPKMLSKDPELGAFESPKAALTVV